MTDNENRTTGPSRRDGQSGGQLSLLHGFGAANLPMADPERAATLPIARVVLDAQLPQRPLASPIATWAAGG